MPGKGKLQQIIPGMLRGIKSQPICLPASLQFGPFDVSRSPAGQQVVVLDSCEGNHKRPSADAGRIRKGTFSNGMKIVVSPGSQSVKHRYRSSADNSA